jgi:crossover junction endodeoxyribonuclease RuvC
VRILGIDPGSRVTGWGILDATGWEMRVVAHGAIRTGDGELPARLCRLASELSALIALHAPASAAVEAVFAAEHARAALVLGHARGVALLVIAQAGVPLSEYPPARVKSAVTGSGRAEKEQVQRALATQLGMRELPRPLDASDALAVALCHASLAKMERTLESMDRHDAAEIASELRPGASRRRSQWMRKRLAR